MENSTLLDRALEKLIGDMDDMEGSGALSHSVDECSDPLGCKMHDDELGENLAGDGKPSGVEIEVRNIGKGIPSMEGAKAETPGEEVAEHEGGSEDGLSPEEAEELRKLLK